MDASKNGNRICSDLVCNVAIGSNTIRAYEDSFDITLSHKVTSHTVCDERQWDSLTLEFACCEAGTLKHWSGFINKHVELFACMVSHVDRGQRCANTSRCKRTSVAMGQKYVPISYETCS